MEKSKRAFFVQEEGVGHCLQPSASCLHEHHFFLASAAREAFSNLRREWHITTEGEIAHCLQPTCPLGPHFLTKAEVVRHHKATYDFSGPWRLKENPFVSLLEEEIFTLLSRLGYRLERNTRTVIGPSELDLYFPQLRVALEVNGDHWHGEEMMALQHHSTPEAYHRGKKARAEAQGVMVGFLWESNWLQDWLTCLDVLCDFLQFRRYDPLLTNLKKPLPPMELYWEACDRCSMEKHRGKISRKREKALTAKEGRGSS